MGENSGDRFDEIEVDSIQTLYGWLDEHCEQADGVWLITYKKVVPEKYIDHGEVLDALVAYGWCDGIARRIDDERTMQLVSPRRTQPWAKTYKDRADRLEAEGRMRPHGIMSVERAKATGMWEAMNDVDALVVPDDLRQALLAADPANERFDSFPPSTRRNILRWIESAKTDKTRQKRIGLTVEEARHNRRVKSNG